MPNFGEYFWSSYHSVMSWTGSLDKGEWLLVLIGGVVVGFLCLRGFGSRQGY